MDSDEYEDEAMKVDINPKSVYRNKLKTICSKLAELGEESCILTVDTADKSCKYIASQIGEKFLSGRIELLEQFFKLCYDHYASAASSSATDDDMREKVRLSEENIIRHHVNKNNLVHSKSYVFDVEDIQKMHDNTGTGSKDNGKHLLGLTNEIFSQDADSYKDVEERNKSATEYVDNQEDDDNYDDNEDEVSTYKQEDDDYEDKEEKCNAITKKSSDKGSSSGKQKVLKSVRKSSRRMKIPLKMKPYFFIASNAKEKFIKHREKHKNLNDMDMTVCNVDEESKSHKIKFTCPNCKKSFSQSRFLLSHMTQVHKKKCYICRCCGKIFDLKEDLMEHEIEHEQTKDNISIFESVGGNIKSKKVSFTCPTCEKGFSENRFLLSHMTQAHGYKCSICKFCGKIFDSKEEKEQHEKEHTHEEHINISNYENKEIEDTDTKITLNFTCPTCKKVFSGRRFLLSHMTQVHRETCNICKLCGKLFHSKEELKTHEEEDPHSDSKHESKQMENKSKIVTFICPTCEKDFSGRRFLLSHMKQAHGETCNICKYCGKIFDLKEDLMKHEFEHNKSDVKNTSINESVGREGKGKKVAYICPTCAKIFSKSRFLMSHMKQAHGYKCSICKFCGEIFSSKEEKDKHEREHIYSDSTSSYGKNEDLEDESKIVTFACPICKKAFLERQFLLSHMTQAHRETCNICKYCGKIFDLKEELITHENDHTNSDVTNMAELKTFTCPVCEKSFSQCRFLLSHITQVHRKKYSICKHCGKTFTSTADLAKHMEKHTYMDLKNMAEYQVEKMLGDVERDNGNKKSSGKASKAMEQNDEEFEDKIIKKESTVVKNQWQNDTQEHIVEICDQSENMSESVLNSEVEPEELDVENQIDRYCCEICSAKFHWKSSLFRHLRNRHTISERSKLRVQANMQRIDSNRQNLVRNKISGKYVCNYCGRSFLKKCGLIVHQQMHSNNPLYACDHCGKTFKFSQSLRLHLKIIHKDEQFICKYCRKMFPSSLELKKHLKIMHQREYKRLYPKRGVRKWFHCNVCRKICATELQLKNHMQVHLSGSDPTYSCHICGKIFLKTFLLTAHLTRIHKMRQSVCRICSQRFPSKAELLIHIRVHDLNNPNTCRLCGKKFDDLNELTEHKQTHSEGAKHMCEFCGKTFNKMSELNVHKRYHSGEKPFKCKVCDMGFVSNPSLRNHMYSHAKSKQFQCEECGMSFKRYTSLQSHAHVHSNRTFKCRYCDREFRTKEGANHHMLREHEDSLDLTKIDFKFRQCEFCSKLFAQKHTYDRHVATHTGEYNVICDVCGKRFQNVSARNRHKYTHNPTKRYMCEICNMGTNTKRKLNDHLKSNKHLTNCENLGITLEESKGKILVYDPPDEENKQEQIESFSSSSKNKDMALSYQLAEIPLAVSSIENQTTECVIISLPDNIAFSEASESQVTYID